MYVLYTQIYHDVCDWDTNVLVIIPLSAIVRCKFISLLLLPQAIDYIFPSLLLCYCTGIAQYTLLNITCCCSRLRHCLCSGKQSACGRTQIGPMPQSWTLGTPSGVKQEPSPSNPNVVYPGTHHIGWEMTSLFKAHQPTSGAFWGK